MIHPDRCEVVPEPVASGLRYRVSQLRREAHKGGWMAARKATIAPKTVKGAAVAIREYVRNFLAGVKSWSRCNAGIQVRSYVHRGMPDRQHRAEDGEHPQVGWGERAIYE